MLHAGFTKYTILPSCDCGPDGVNGEPTEEHQRIHYGMWLGRVSPTSEGLFTSEVVEEKLRPKVLRFAENLKNRFGTLAAICV